MQVSLSFPEIESVLRELRPRIIGQRIRKIFQLDEDTIALEMRRPRYLIISVSPGEARIHTSEKIKKLGKTLRFGTLLRKTLSGLFLESIDLLGRDRVVKMCFGRPVCAAIIAEMTGKGGDIVVLDGEERVVDALHPKKSHPGKIRGYSYSPPFERPMIKNQENRFAAHEGSIDSQIAMLYTERAGKKEIAERKKYLRSALKRKIKNQERKIKLIDQSLEKAATSQIHGKWADLLLAHAGKIPEGAHSVRVADLFEDGEPIEIPLDSSKTIFENAQRYYKSSRRGLKTKEIEGIRRKKSEKERIYLQCLLTELEDDAVAEHIEEFEKKADFLLKERTATEQKKGKESRKPYREFVSKNGLKILVGRSARDNHELTFHVARGRDLWMHVTGRPGPHVIIRVKNGEPDSESILDGATLAVYHAMHSRHGEAEVVYTFKKNVKPVKGFPGKANFSNPKTIFLRMEPSRLERLLKGRQES